MKRLLISSMMYVIAILPSNAKTINVDAHAIRLKSDMCIAIALYHEARGADFESWQNIFNVIVSRKIAREFPNTYCGVVWDMKPVPQFSFTADNISDTLVRQKDFQKLLAVARSFLNGGSGKAVDESIKFYAVPHIAENNKFFQTLNYQFKDVAHAFFSANK